MSDSDAVLVLADGTVIKGKGLGCHGNKEGEVVFNTSMTGYQEALSDPSYKYQILTFTYPLLGNYGINETDFESDNVHVRGVVVKEACQKPLHPFMKKTLNKFFEEHSITGIEGVDTRALTRKLRNFGVMNGILKFPYDENEIEELKEKAKKIADISTQDLVSMVTIKEPKIYKVDGAKKMMIDCGEKESIAKNIIERKINLTGVPANFSAAQILEYGPDGIIISNGPGDPKRTDYVIKTVQELMKEKIPIFGICLGHQILALSSGANTYKLKFGHRGSNQPVKDLITGKCYVTSQNHGFAVNAESANNANLEVTQINLNDGSVEGLRSKDLKMFSVQYHPEVHPGPYRLGHIFDEFKAML
ncbi:MAG: carbamoyl phosphate synthase small subunit [Candidatus Altiarchaeales archaeon A3]|nr:MAG: carbamoyl phosphate synthase small subunit [Candidatus Altiarchaeales archaeon A3]